MKRTLGRAAAGKYRDRIATWCFQHASASGKVLPGALRRHHPPTSRPRRKTNCERSATKERRVDPQIVVGLLVDRGGFPVEIGCFEGNRAETPTMIPIIKQFKARHSLTDMIVVADAGMHFSGQPAGAG